MSSTRDAEAAMRFFCKALHVTADSAPQVGPVQELVALPTISAESPTSTMLTLRVINVDKNAASPKAIAELEALGVLSEPVELRQVKYLDTLIEQDHRFIKRLTKPGMGFFSFETAWRTLQGFEMMNMIRKGQMQGANKGNILAQVAFISRLFTVVA